jgi:hypothetical protein
MRVRYPIILALASALALGNATHALATTYGFSVHLSGLNEVGPNASPATGVAFIVYDDVANTVTTNGNFSGLLGQLTAGHFHGPAPVGVNAAVIHGFVGLPLGSTFGSWSDVWSGLTSTQVTYLMTGQLYVNLHSNVFPGGEIRDQVRPDATPTNAVSWGRIKTLYR